MEVLGRGVVFWVTFLGAIAGIVSFLFSLYLYYVRDNIQRELLLANLYEPGLDEVSAIQEEDSIPGTVGERYGNSFVSGVSRIQFLLMDAEVKSGIERYGSLLKQLESAEIELAQVVPEIGDRFQDMMVATDETSVSLLVQGVAGDQIDAEKTGPNAPEINSFTTQMPFELFFSNIDLGVLEAKSTSELRDYIVAEDPEEGEFDLDKIVIQHSNDDLTGRRVAFLDENFPGWDEKILEGIKDNLVEEYLAAKKNEEESLSELRDVSQGLRDLFLDRIPAEE